MMAAKGTSIVGFIIKLILTQTLEFSLELLSVINVSGLFNIQRALYEVPIDVFATSECIHLYIVPRCLFREVSVM